MRNAALLALGALVSLACQASPAPGASCVRTSECATPLVCRHGRCRTECREARDCPIGTRCLIDATGLGVCGLPPEQACSADAECGSDLACGGGECRTRCAAPLECGASGSCASDGTCVVPRSGDDAGAPATDMGMDVGTDAAASDDAAVPHDAFVVLTDAGRPASGTGAACDAGSSCTTGYLCRADVDPAATPVCRRTCTLDSECLTEGPGSFCHGTCTVPCDAFANTGCGSDVCGIYPASDMASQDVSFTDCRVNGGGAALAACVSESDCGPGLTCFHSLCRTICHADAPAPGGCGAGEGCVVLRPLVGTSTTPFGACCPSGGSGC